MRMSDNRERFWKLLEPEYVGAMMFCRKLTVDRERGDDLFQDALLLAYTRIWTLRDEAAFRPWLYRIIINAFRSQTRRPLWRRMVPMTPDIEVSLAGEDPAAAYTARRWLQQAFRVLSPRDQALVTLHELQGWPVVELAQLLNTTEGAVKARLFRCRARLRRVLEAGLTAAARPTAAAQTIGEKSCAVTKPGSD